MATTTIEGQLEVDHERGVIYFHSNEGYTVLRICNVPKPIPEKPKQIREFGKKLIKPPYQLDYTMQVKYPIGPDSHKELL